MNDTAMKDTPTTLNLHDLLSKGDVEAALTKYTALATNDKVRDNNDELGTRLPLLLRLLSVAQPLANTVQTNDIQSDALSSTQSPNPNVIVPLLENIAASYPDAENIEVLVSSIAPSVCKLAFEGLTPLTKSEDKWNIESLNIALSRLADPMYIKHSKRKQPIDDNDGSKKRQKLNKTRVIEEDDDDNMDMMQDRMKPQNEELPVSSATDTYNKAMCKVLYELISLVISSLPTKQNGNITEDGAVVESGVDDRQLSNPFFQETGFVTPGLALKSDSLFSESEDISSSLGGGWSNLSVVIPTLMQNASILNHEHVANALCRAAVPQAPMLIKAMAANCPAATQGLLRGCVAAYQLADKFEVMSSNTAINHIEEVEHTGKSSQIKDIIRTSVEAAECLASLSPTVAMHVIRILKKANVMDGLVLSLLIKRESTDAASYLIDKLVSSDEIDTSRLYKELAEDKELAENARRFISQRMIISYKADDINLDEISLLTKSYTLLVYFIGVGSGSSDGSGSKLVEDSMSAIRVVAGNSESISDKDLPTKYPNDNAYKNAMCAAIVTCCRYPPIGDSDGGSLISVPAVKACFECVSNLLLHPESIESAIISSRLSGFLIDGDAKSLLSVVLGTILSNSVSNECRKEEDMPQITSVCHWLSSKIESDKLKTMHSMGMTMTSIAHDPIVAAEAMRRSTTQTTNELDDLVKNILSDQDTCTKIICHSSAVTLVKESVAMLVRRPEPHIPLVLPLSLERVAQSLPWKEVMNGIQEPTSHLFSQFILQLVYALEFLKHQPDSPFVVNPRSLPLKEILELLDLSGQKDSDYKDLSTALKDLCSLHCPDIVKATQQEGRSDDDELIGGKHAITPTLVGEAIRDCLNGDAVDPSGLRAERMFLHSRQVYPQLEVDTAAVTDMLSVDDSSRSKYYSYVSLCKDPLLLLKARAAVWKLRGTRRILLEILDSLMLANECIALEQSSSQIVAQDYLTSRDAIIVRCIVFACQSGFTFGECENKVIPRARHCALCVSIVQSIILKRRGVMTVLIRQGLPEKCIDWIVEFIPDCLSDGPIITALLSDKLLLSATERLNAASAGLQIAVAHYHLDESIAKELVVASMNVLLDSFTLVVGPVGVPVSVLREENGQDVTSICKTEMFHMLKTLSTISPKNIDLKNEACTTLSKISAMCKSENAASATPRRKALLKEIWERCLSVNSKLGGALQL